MASGSLALLAALLDGPLSSIEILPGGLEEWASQSTRTHQEFPFVLVEGHLGIPQKVLYKVYMAAVALYKCADEAAILPLSSVVLLANPAHQTVLHTRKKLITQRLLDPIKELDLIDLYIRGSKECAKQSIIWDHRRWIFRNQYEPLGKARARLVPESPGWGTSEEASDLPTLPLRVMEKECDLIRRACELYPRNYHAWTHWHWVMDVARAAAASLQSAGSVDHIRFVQEEVRLLRNWIGQHVSDYSAVHQLCSFVLLERGGVLQLAESGGVLVDELREHALGLVLSYPPYEALWLYLRNTLILSSPESTGYVVDRLRREGLPTRLIENIIR